MSKINTLDDFAILCTNFFWSKKVKLYSQYLNFIFINFVYVIAYSPFWKSYVKLPMECQNCTAIFQTLVSSSYCFQKLVYELLEVYICLQPMASLTYIEFDSLYFVEIVICLRAHSLKYFWIQRAAILDNNLCCNLHVYLEVIELTEQKHSAIPNDYLCDTQSSVLSLRSLQLELLNLYFCFDFLHCCLFLIKT